MLAKDAYSALGPTLTDIADILKKSGLETTTKCSFSDVDLSDHEVLEHTSALMYGEITFSHGNVAAALECAVSVIEGEVADDELLSEIASLRAEARRIGEIASRVGADKLFDALESEEESDEAENKVDTEDLFNSFLESIKDEDEDDMEILRFEKEQRGIGHLPFIIGGVAIVVIIILLTVLL